MKRNRICYLLAIIAMFTAFNVYAEHDLVGWSFCDGGVDQDGIRYSINGHKYTYHVQQVRTKTSLGDLRMYCTRPHTGSGTADMVNSPANLWCDLADTDHYPTSYKLLKRVQETGENNEKVLDIAFRMAGVYDRHKFNGQIVTASSDYQMRAFLNTYLIRVLNQTNTGFAANDLITGNEVEAAIKLLVDSKDYNIDDMKPSTNPNQEGTTNIFTLTIESEHDGYNIYKVTSNRPVNEDQLVVSPSGVHVDWIENWNGTSGKIKVSAGSSNCNGSVTFSANVQVGNTSAIYTCGTNRSDWQNYIAIGPSKVGDTFDVSACEVKDCIRSGCGTVEKKDEFKDIDIRNCCEEGATTKVRQAALNELFCKDGTLNIDYYKPKCNAEEYIEEDASSEYCKMYCGATAMYKLPGPTRAKADAYFWFDKTQTGTTGPKLDQYKRCRYIIKFDTWLKAYEENSKGVVESINAYNNYVTELQQIMATTGHDHTETITISCPPAAGQTVAQVSRETITMTEYSVPSAIYTLYKYNLDTRNYSSLTFSVDGPDRTRDGNYYAKLSIDAYNDKVNDLKNSHTNCTVSSNSFVSIESVKSEVETNARASLANYNEFIRASGDLRDGLTKCSGSTNSSGVTDTSAIKNKVKFNGEPEMEFSYNQVYLNDEGKLVNQELKVEFEKVGENKKCVYQVYDSLDQPNPKSDDWNENWDIKKIYDEQYSAKFGSSKVLAIDTAKAYNGNLTQLSLTDNLSSDKFYASKKFTIDAVGHMSCRWQDSPTNTTYTLIPRGIVVSTETIEGNIKDLGDNYTNREGTYQIVKTHAKGKFETYFTLRNLADGIFDDIIHDGGQTCAERDASIHAQPDKTKPDRVNATCYIEVDNNGFNLYDCTQDETIAKNDDLNNKCCKNGNCTGDSVLAYKEVDPENLLPNVDQYKDDPGYAWNWLKAEGAQQVLKDIQQKAADDKTYSNEELTYSFTLTPKALKEIRAYNKAMTKQGGYTDFNMRCNKETYNGATVLVQCKSKFLEAISGKGALPYGDGQKLDINVSNKDLFNESRKDWN